MKIMTMKQFLQNPSGSYSASFARRDLIIANLEDRFAKLMNKRKNDFKMIIFRGNNKNEIYFYFQIPSEDIPELFYDVVLQFIPVDMKCLSNQTINDYALNVFSNSPNFLYTYAYWYNKDDIIVKSLKDKVGKKALEEVPKIKNAEGIYGFEKSVYFALLYIKYNNLNQKFTINSFIQENQSITKIKPKIKTCSSKMFEYTTLKKKYNLEKQQEKKKMKDLNKKVNNKFSF